MKASFKKLLAWVLTSVMLLSVFAGCSKQQDTVNSDTLVITVAKLGYGDDWLKAIAAAYEEKTGTKVEIISKIGDAGLSAIKGEMQSQVAETDIFFTRAQEFFKSIYKGGVNIGGTNYDCEFADLSDVWNSVASDGESKTIKEKMDPAFEAYYNVDGKYYGLPWALSATNMCGTVWDLLTRICPGPPRNCSRCVTGSRHRVQLPLSTLWKQSIIPPLPRSGFPSTRAVRAWPITTTV